VLRVKTAEAARRIKENLVLLEFCNSNYRQISKNKKFTQYSSLRLEMPLFRVVTALSYLVIISLWSLPLAALILLILIELVYLIGIIIVPKVTKCRSIFISQLLSRIN